MPDAFLKIKIYFIAKINLLKHIAALLLLLHTYIHEHILSQSKAKLIYYQESNL